jgi:glucose-6-phosphate 1-dehydrogenase
MARRAISTEVMPFGWVEISDAALRRLQRELEHKGQGVVDEMGVLAIHAGYADYFFPGTSVLQTRPRYLFFACWNFLWLARQRGVTAANFLKRKDEAELSTGDLTKRLVVPALYNLSRSKVLPEQFALIGVARSDDTAESWRERLHDMLKSFVGRAGAEFNTDHIDEDAWARLADAMTYVSGDLTKPDLYEDVRAALDEAEKAHGTRGNAIFYLAVADRLFGAVVEQLGKAKLTDQGEDQNGGRRFWRRVVIEKPFGHSLDSARALNSQILRTLHEDQIFRIDHFLGKDTVQNIMAFRFANGIFEPMWNRDRIDHVQITAAETIGVEGRGSFYEATGARAT